jgi:hypothetical protein
MLKLSTKNKPFYVMYFCIFFFSFCSFQANAAGKSWQKHFVKKESEIPTNKFRAYYFDERTAGITMYTEVVDRPAANFVRDRFHGIPGDNFGVYWVGYFEFSETTNIIINKYQSRAESEILINGEPFRNKSTEYLFTPGRHKIEVQYVSNYFSVSFLVTMLKNLEIHNDASLIESLGNATNKTVWYCGAYESDNFDMSVNLSTKASNAPVILLLSSYQPIVWKINTSRKTNLHAIVLSSYGPRSTIENVPDNVKVLHYDKLPYVYDLISSSSSSSNSRNTFKNLAYKSQDLIGKKPSGFSGKYGLKSVSVPETILNEAKYSQFGMLHHGERKPDIKSRKTGSRLDRVFE